MRSDHTNNSECKPTLEIMNEIISKNEKYLSFYRGKFIQFDCTSGEMIRWDNTLFKLMERINEFGQPSNNTFVYEVPLQ